MGVADSGSTDLTELFTKIGLCRSFNDGHLRSRPRGLRGVWLALSQGESPYHRQERRQQKWLFPDSPPSYITSTAPSKDSVALPFPAPLLLWAQPPGEGAILDRSVAGPAFRAWGQGKERQSEDQWLEREWPQGRPPLWTRWLLVRWLPAGQHDNFGNQREIFHIGSRIPTSNM